MKCAAIQENNSAQTVQLNLQEKDFKSKKYQRRKVN